MKLKGNSSRLREGQAFLPGSIRDPSPALVVKTATSNHIESAFHLKSINVCLVLYLFLLIL